MILSTVSVGTGAVVYIISGKSFIAERFLVLLCKCCEVFMSVLRELNALAYFSSTVGAKKSLHTVQYLWRLREELNTCSIRFTYKLSCGLSYYIHVGVAVQTDGTF